MTSGKGCGRPKKKSDGRRILSRSRLVVGIMKPELRYLTLTALLTGALWIPVVIGYVRTRGVLRPADYKVAPSSPLADWVNRANRAHVNAVESFAPFAAVVIAANAAGVSTPLTVASAAVFFWARVAHAVIHISGFSLFMARTLAFSVAFGAFVAIAVEVLRQ
jgi:uncharacterized MAPEG superfamily protein